MGCTSGKTSNNQQLQLQKVRALDQKAMLKDIQLVIGELETLKAKQIVNYKESSLPLDLFVENSLFAHQPVSPKDIESLFNMMNKIFISSNFLIASVRLILEAYQRNLVQIQREAREVFEDFLELFSQIDAAFLQTPLEMTRSGGVHDELKSGTSKRIPATILESNLIQ